MNSVPPLPVLLYCGLLVFAFSNFVLISSEEPISKLLLELKARVEKEL